MIVKVLTEHRLVFLSLKEVSSESNNVVYMNNMNIL